MISVPVKMSQKSWISSIVFVLPQVVHLISTEVCTTKNMTCTEAKDNAGHYQFNFETPRATVEIEINEEGTSLVRGHFVNLRLSPDVVDCNDKSIIRHTCSNFSVKFIQEQGSKISESCLAFNIIEDHIVMTSSPGWNIIIIGVAMVLLIACAAMGYLWTRNRERKGCGLPACAFKRRGSYDTQGQESPRDAEEENRLNSLQEQEEHLLDGKSNSPECNGRSEHVSIDMEDMPTKSDDKGVPRVNGALQHEGQTGNLRHDPGGGTKDTGLHCTDICLNEGTLGEQDIDEEQHWPRSQGSGPGFDETAGGEGQVLVNSLGPNGDHTSLPDRRTHCERSIMLEQNII